MPRLLAAATASTVRPVVSPTCSLITFNNCRLLSSTLTSQHPTPPGLPYGILSLYPIGVGLTPTLLLLDRLRLHLLLPSFLPNLLQQLPPMLSDPEHRAVNVIVIRNSLPCVPQVLSLLLALQQIVVD